MVPLAIYLATFVLAFARTGRALPRRTTRAAAALAFAVVISSTVLGAMPVVMVVVVTMILLGLVSYGAHAQLAADRPAPEHLTTFFLVIAAGGALGGLLNGLVAPVAFDRVLEYRSALTVVPLLLLGVGGREASWVVRQVAANRVRAVLVLAVVVLAALGLRSAVWLSPRTTPTVVALLVVAVVVGWSLSRLPAAMVLALTLLFALSIAGDSRGQLEQTRSFFGTYTVRSEQGTHRLVHGTTIHGTQFVDAERRDLPTTYYAPTGPLGDVFDVAPADRVAAIGLGTGTIAAYGQPGQSLTFFEIDPVMVRIASDPRLFTYVSDSAASVSMVVGDGRLKVAEEQAESYDLMVLDAFSSDAIPVHLLTAEAMEVYAERLDDDGLLVAHISNRVFDLEPVLAAAAHHLGWTAVVGRSTTLGPGETPSTWVALSPDPATIEELLARPGWSGVGSREVSWTDDYVGHPPRAALRAGPAALPGAIWRIPWGVLCGECMITTGPW